MTDDITQNEVDEEVVRRLVALGAVDLEVMREAVDAIHAACCLLYTSPSPRD